MTEPCGVLEFVCVQCGLLFQTYRPGRDEVERPVCPTCARIETEHEQGCDSESVGLGDA